jgi:hypothetical protein
MKNWNLVSAVSFRPVPAEARVQFQVEKVALGQNFLQVRPFFSPFVIIQPVLRTLFINP